jgi:peptidoglycan DL-endopeptidase LytE
LVRALLTRTLAIACALVTIALTAGLSPQAVSTHRTQGQPPPTPGPDDVAIATELARIHAHSGSDPGGPDQASGGLVHIVAAGETLQTIAIEFHVSAKDLLDANDLRRAGQVSTGFPLRIPGAKPLTSAPMAGGGKLTYRASEEDHFPWGWCTWYVAQRRDVPWNGDARTWLASARELGWPTGQTPQVGAIMVTNESYWYGHVTYVEKVNPDGSWLVSEMNYQGFGVVDFRTIRPSQVPKQVPVLGFIY